MMFLNGIYVQSLNEQPKQKEKILEISSIFMSFIKLQKI